MHLSKAFERSCKVFGPSKLFVDQDNNTSTDYKTAWEVSFQHAVWIKKNIDIVTTTTSTQSESLLRSQAEFINDEIIVSKKRYPNVIIAYLSQNCPDLLLSIFGCFHLMYNMKSNITPAMLNFRWTSKQIAQSLSIDDIEEYLSLDKDDNVDFNSYEFVTCLVYGKGLEDKAKDAAIILSALTSKRHVKHHVLTLPLPLLTKTGKISTTHNELHKNFLNESNSITYNDSVQSLDNSDALILFTSGSTGGPKGVRLSNRALFSQSIAKILPPCSYSPETRMVASTVPYFHIGGLSSALAIILAGGMLIDPPKLHNRTHTRKIRSTKQPNSIFQPTTILQSLLASNTIPTKSICPAIASNTLVLVPAMLHSLLSEINETLYTLQDNIKLDNPFSHVKLILIGGQGISNAQFQKTRQIFVNARIVQTFACTEAASSITFAQLHPKTQTDNTNIASSTNNRKIGDYVGIPPSHIQIAIYPNTTDENVNGSQNKYHHSNRQNITHSPFLPPYQIGLIATRGPHVMNGYWKRSYRPKSFQLQNKEPKYNGWFISNDLGYIDDQNRLFFCGRANDVIRTGGETVFASEIERVIQFHEDIEDCVVIALPDEKFGEAVSAIILLKKDKKMKYLKKENESKRNVFYKTIRDHCARNHLPGYKCPKNVFLYDNEFPRNASGKILKHEIKEWALKTERKIHNDTKKILTAQSKL